MPGPANVTVGRLASLAPSSKVRRADSAAICAASVPRHSAVDSLARTLLASLISLPCNEESRASSSTYKSDNSFNRVAPFSSYVLRQTSADESLERLTTSRPTPPQQFFPHMDLTRE